MTTPAQPTRPDTRRVAARALTWAVNTLMAVALLAFAGLAIGPHLFGYRTATMLTGSMAPQIEPGDIIVLTQMPTSDIKVGDVLTYQIPIDDRRVVSHRVTEVEHSDNGTATIRTKGDANPAVDPWTAQIADSTVWKVRWSVPVVGHVIRALRAPAVHTALVWVAPAILVVLLLSSIWRAPKAGTASPATPGPAPTGTTPVAATPVGAHRVGAAPVDANQVSASPAGPFRGTAAGVRV